ncbi:MAG: sulfatase [Bacteroidales bacterium]|nr:sulfatase [Bacteroidales bacterium]
MRKLILLLSVVLYLGCASTKQDNIKPNIVFILADDLGWADLPLYGNKFNEAPNITQLANEGVTFDNAYASCPVCSPTRASIQTGQYPARIGLIDFIPGHYRPYEKVTVPRNRVQYLPTEAYTLGEAMQSAGYKTGYFGKWHLGFGMEHLPEKQGYEEAISFTGGPFYGFGSRLHPKQDLPDDKLLSEALTDFGIDFIEKNKDQPFFLFLAHYDVHVQLDADSALIQEFLKKPKVDGYPCNAIYAAMVKHVDNSVGRIQSKLEELGLAENTIVVFYSDNGGLVSRFDKIPLIAKSKRYVYEGDTLLYVASSNAPLRSEKGTVYEGGIREPFIVKWPGKLKAGTRTNAIMTSTDLLPTFAEMAGAKLPENLVLDGKSIVHELKTNEFDYERPIFWHYPVYHHDVPASAVRKGDWKLVENLENGSLELYNLKDDIGENKNLAESNKEKTNELMTLLENWRKDLDARKPVPNENFNQEKRHIWEKHPDWYKAIKRKKSLEKVAIKK